MAGFGAEPHFKIPAKGPPYFIFSFTLPGQRDCSMEQTTHTPIRARRKDGYMRLLAVAGPILLRRDLNLSHKTQTRILPGIPSARKQNLCTQLLHKGHLFLG